MSFMDLQKADPWGMAADIFDPQPMPYTSNPVGWVKDRLGEFPWSKQCEVLDSVVANRRTAVPSAHDTGKSFIAARAACWWIDQHPPGEAFVVTTAPTGHQVKAILWREINKVAAKCRLPGKVNQLEWWIGSQQVGLGRKPNDYSPTAFQGIHARYVLVVIDEACGVPAALWEAVDTLITNIDCRILAIGNPDDPTSEFSRVCVSEDWNTIRINGLESPNLSGENIPADVRPYLLSDVWVEEKRRKWGEESPLWMSKVLGKFPDVSTDTVIPLSWIRRAAERTMDAVHKPNGLMGNTPKLISCDVARYGADETIIGLRVGKRFRILERKHGQSTVETARAVQRQMRYCSASKAQVDDNGLGAGVVDSLEDWNETVVPINTSIKPKDEEHYLNARAEWYWDLRAAFEFDEIYIDDDEDFIAQLSSIKYKIVPGTNKIQIESKDDMKKRGLPSPDMADCLMIAWADPTRGRKANIDAAPMGIPKDAYFRGAG